MIADDLAIRICREYVQQGTTVLDPFCGTGRTLIAAAEQGGSAFGIDVNPLAVLLTSAKAGTFREKRFERLLTQIENSILARTQESKLYDFNQGRKVKWFSLKATNELSLLINVLNRQSFSKSESTLLAAILSATARDVSYCRKDQWKIHRMSPSHRSVFRASALKVFSFRLRYAITESKRCEKLEGTCKAVLGDSTQILGDLTRKDKMFDLVFTSPPYGDSRTTVQYGGVSALCIGVIKHLACLDFSKASTHSIDSCCLGGGPSGKAVQDIDANWEMHSFWKGQQTNKLANRVHLFLADLDNVCRKAVRVVRRQGHIILVVGRRTVGGHELKIDKFLIDMLSAASCTLLSASIRKIKGKMTPYIVHRSGHSKNQTMDADHVTTMRKEHVLIFRKD